ncbi:MAG: alpha/beta fold hydrolase [Nannocystaceae bacterium]|nr:alpha/beta fold hydrolase [Myxococcales bacterium]
MDVQGMTVKATGREARALGVTEKTIRAYGTNVRYLEAGHGPPLVLIHGIGESASCWSANLEALAAHFHIYAPDVVGWGRTPPSDQHDYTMASYARFNLAFMDAIGLARANIIGWSLGGASALWAALAEPDRFERVMLIDSAGLGAEVHWLFRVLQVPGLGELVLAPHTAAAYLRYKYLFTRQRATVTREYLDEAIRDTRYAWHRQTVFRTLRAHSPLWRGQRDIDVHERLHELPMPVHILWGREDAVIPCKHGERAVTRLQQGELTIFEDCGHMPMLEYQQRFNELAIRFFRG